MKIENKINELLNLSDCLVVADITDNLLKVVSCYAANSAYLANSTALYFVYGVIEDVTDEIGDIGRLECLNGKVIQYIAKIKSDVVRGKACAENKAERNKRVAEYKKKAAESKSKIKDKHESIRG